MNNRRLYVGLDLRNDRTQISIIGPMQMEPEVIGANDEVESDGVPTVVSIPGTNEIIHDFLDKIVKQEPIMASGVESDPVNVLAAFLRRTLSLTKKKYPNEAIRQIVVTTEYKDFKFISTVYQALQKLGIDKERAVVVDRRQSYIYYVMSQKKELWVNCVGLFDYHGDVLTYYQMQTDRFKRPALVTVVEKNYNDYAKLFADKENNPEEKAALFEGMVQGAIHGQIITSLYMTGDGFDSGFADNVMKKLCVGRHLFQGDNLYVNGACYMAREVSGDRKMSEFVYLDEDTVPAHITMNVYSDAKVQEMAFVKAGTPWYQVDHETDLIPDGDEELELRIRNVITKDTQSHLILMEGVRGRTDRKTRVGVRVRFAGPEKCIITVRDKGFGETFPSSFRIWEETITL